MGIIIAGIVFIALCFWLIWYIDNYKARQVKRSLEEKRIRDEQEAHELVEKKKEQQDKMIKSAVDNFEKAGWTEWDQTIHMADGQLKRIERAQKSTTMRIAQYNPISGYAKVQGEYVNYYITSGKGCSCPDYRERLLPCKHMYFLASSLSDIDAPIYDRQDNIPSVCKDNMFRGLRFTITGRGQENVKRYILSHCGSFSNSSWRDISAVIMADGKETSKVLEAKSKNIMTFSFDELKTMFLEESSRS